MARRVEISTEIALDDYEPESFALTRRIHNLIHGEGAPELTEYDRILSSRSRWLGRT